MRLSKWKNKKPEPIVKWNVEKFKGKGSQKLLKIAEKKTRKRGTNNKYYNKREVEKSKRQNTRSSKKRSKIFEEKNRER